MKNQKERPQVVGALGDGPALLGPQAVHADLDLGGVLLPQAQLVAPQADLHGVAEGGHLVGNWPGVTVEKKEGEARLGDAAFTVVDLPGIYSLSPYSMEELVARKFIIEERPDAIIDIQRAQSPWQDAPRW
mgnify:CR=1 FL=1